MLNWTVACCEYVCALCRDVDGGAGFCHADIGWGTLTALSLILRRVGLTEVTIALLLDVRFRVPQVAEVAMLDRWLSVTRQLLHMALAH